MRLPLDSSTVIRQLWFGALSLSMSLATPSLGQDWTAPSDFDHLIPRLARENHRVFSNLRYEGNNRALRELSEPGPDRCAVARATRSLAARTAGLYLLRDALFSQQDHPVHQATCALMLPPNWITVAVDDAIQGRKTLPVKHPPVDDDLAWARIETKEELFGGFSSSETLHRWATRAHDEASAEDRQRIPQARGSVHTLAARGDESCNRPDPSPRLSRRLRDGDLAIERYDITNEKEVLRAIEVLEMLIPLGSTGHEVHIFVGGPLIEAANG